MKYIKGFDDNLKCRDYQFEIGKEYKIENKENAPLELCTNTVFHFCKTLGEVHKFYNCDSNDNNRYCEIEVLGDLVEDAHNCGSDWIKIVREIKEEELFELMVNSENWEFRGCVAKNINCPIEVLAKLSGDNNWGVRSCVAENTNCSIEILEKLSNDDNWEVRYEVAKNVTCPQGILEKLSNEGDGNNVLSQEAKKTLNLLRRIWRNNKW